ncbi:MAG: polysaccharide deacetylase family protein [Candidatus Omnitrophota bacterium]|jgi:hypothetical protein
MTKNIIKTINDHSSNILLAGLITSLCPRYFLKKSLENNKGRQNSWKGKKSCLTISFDCDYPRDVEAMPDVLKLLKKYNFKTSFACVGHWIEKYPGEHKMILDYGHEIVNHTFSHPDNEILSPGRKFKLICREEKKAEIEKCHDVCKDILGYSPVGCRIPHFKNLFSVEIYGILKDLGYKYSSSTLLTNTYSHGMPFMAKEEIWEFPLTTCPKHPFTVFDTWHSFNSKRLFYRMIHSTEEEYINLFKELVELGISTNSYINIYIDPFDVLKMNKFGSILDFINEKEPEMLVATYKDIIEGHEKATEREHS